MRQVFRALLALSVGLSGSMAGVGTVAAQTGGDAGTVRLPLTQYENLEKRAATPGVPVGVTLSRADIQVDARGAVVEVVATVTAHVLSTEWVQVPLLPTGTAVVEASVDGVPLSLTALGGDLVWTVKTPGKKTVTLRYRGRLSSSEAGGSIDVPVPPAAALGVTALIPAVNTELTVVPAAPFESLGRAADHTVVRVTLPQTRQVQFGWRLAAGSRWLVTQAAYAGAPGKQTMRWEGQLRLHLLSDEPIRIPIASTDAAVSAVTLDGKPAVVEEVDDRLLVRVQGRGDHVVTLVFETMIRQESGPTSTTVWIPRPPVTSFVLRLPGDKEVTVSPNGGLEVERAAGPDGPLTIAKVHLPPADDVTFEWSAALPPEVRQELRANAEVYHAVKADEGVVSVTAYVLFGVTRGTTNRMALTLPDGVVVNAVRGIGVSDWRVTDGAAGDDGTPARTLTIYLDRDITNDHRFEVDYELLIGAETEAAPPLSVPLVNATEVHRQRGMVALVHGTELQMTPVSDTEMSAVGVNQLPSWLRDRLAESVTHTYKYVAPEAALTVKLAPFERKLARFDAKVDTLLSLGDGVLKASATVQVSMKSGELMAIRMALPDDVNVLSVSAPSLREHRVVEPTVAGDVRVLEMTFTREVEGTLKLEVGYERVLVPGDKTLSVPLLHVLGANLEAGRVGLEALTAVEVQPTVTERLLPMDAQELPRQMVLRTTNPILLAYKYVHASPPPAMTLEVTRHEEVAVQVAAIDQAHYQTLWTRDGVVLTRARYTVRNRGKQFLRLSLPEGATIWSALLAGQPVKPARSEDAQTVLLPLSSSAEPFVAEIVYMRHQDPLTLSGTIEDALPKPDIVETRTHWDVYLPTDYEYGTVDTNMHLKHGPRDVVMDQHDADLMDVTGAREASFSTEGSARAGVLPLEIEVPTRGRHLALTKLLANQGSTRAMFSLRYRGEGAGSAGAVMVFFGGLLLFVALLRLITTALIAQRRLWAILALAGAVAVVVGLTALDADWLWLLAALGVALLLTGVRWLASRRTTEDGAAPPPTGPSPEPPMPAEA